MGRISQFTRIKHTVLMDVFAKGLLTKREMQIAFVVIRESWGWNKGESNWTKRPISYRRFAKKTGMSSWHVHETAKKMLIEKKLLSNDYGCLAFNEHIDTWGVPEKGTKPVFPKRERRVFPKREQGCSRKGNGGVPEKGTLDHAKDANNPKQDKKLQAMPPTPKESIKETLKETTKESPHILDQIRLHYETKIERKLRTFDKIRQGMLKGRLKTFSAEELKQVIDNIAASDWHMGRDPKTEGKAYSDFELLFRSDRQVEKYLALKPKKGVQSGKRSDLSPESHFTRTGLTHIPPAKE